MSEKIIILDGGMGTMLQAAGLQPGEHPEVFGFHHPEVVKQIHRKYIAAGSSVIYANTFGANRRSWPGRRSIQGRRFSLQCARQRKRQKN